MPELRICIVGCGRAGMIHARHFHSVVPGAGVVALADPVPETLAAAAREMPAAAAFADYRQAIAAKGVDAVVIATPTVFHKDIVLAAAAAGKHVFCEKPMALNVPDCEAMIRAADAAGIVFQIGFMRRFDAGFQRARELLDSGDLGRVMIIKSTGRGPGGPGPWMWDLAKSNGIIAEVNSHDIDSLLWMTGSRPTRVYAEAHNFKMTEARTQFPDFYDNVVATFRFENDAIGVVDGTCPAGYGYDARMEILCEKGVIFIGSAKQHGVELITIEGEVRGRAVPSWRTLFRDAYLAEARDFVECAATGRAPRVTSRDGLLAVAGVVAVNESIRTGQPVTL